MPLTCDYRNVKNVKKIDQDEISRFVFVMSAIKMNEITTKNVDEIVFRLKFAEKCNYNFLTGSLSFGSLKAYIRSMIGYKTNVRTETRNAYMRGIMKIVESNLNEELLRQ
jgi:hypothetical protein